MDAEDAAPASAPAPPASDAAEEELVGEPVKMTFPQRVDLYGFPLLREEFRQFTEVAEESRRKNEAAALEVDQQPGCSPYGPPGVHAAYPTRHLPAAGRRRPSPAVAGSSAPASGGHAPVPVPSRLAVPVPVTV